VVCFCVCCIKDGRGSGSGSERRGTAMVLFCLQPMVQLQLLHQGFMVAVVMAIGFCYRVYAIVFSTRGFWKDRGINVGMLSFIFIPNDAGCTWCLLSVFQRRGGHHQ